MKKTTKSIGALIAITLVSRQSSSLLGIGKHETTIVAVEDAEASENDEYSDRTPQLKVTFQSNETKGKFSHWFNLCAYKRFADLTDAEKASKKFASVGDAGYAVLVKTKKRVQDPEATEKALNILNGLLFNCGFPAGEAVEAEDLIGKEVGIEISMNDRQNARVKSTFMLASVKEAMEEQA